MIRQFLTGSAFIMATFLAAQSGEIKVKYGTNQITSAVGVEKMVTARDIEAKIEVVNDNAIFGRELTKKTLGHSNQNFNFMETWEVEYKGDQYRALVYEKNAGQYKSEDGKVLEEKAMCFIVVSTEEVEKLKDAIENNKFVDLHSYHYGDISNRYSSHGEDYAYTKEHLQKVMAHSLDNLHAPLMTLLVEGVTVDDVGRKVQVVRFRLPDYSRVNPRNRLETAYFEVRKFDFVKLWE